VIIIEIVGEPRLRERRRHSFSSLTNYSVNIRPNSETFKATLFLYNTNSSAIRYKYIGRRRRTE
jgi:hypothetical protein